MIIKHLSMDIFVHAWISMDMDLRWCPRISIDMSPWISSDVRGYSRIYIHMNGFPLISLDMNGFPCPWISIDIHGQEWKSVHGYPLIFMDMHCQIERY